MTGFSFKRICTWVTAILILSPTGILAHEPDLVGYNIIEQPGSGIPIAGPNFGGDTTVLLGLFASSEQVTKETLFLVFPGCGNDPKTAGRPVLNLDAVIGRRASPEYRKDWKAPESRWRLCPEKQYVLIEPGSNPRSPTKFSVELDFLRLTNARLHPTLEGNAYMPSAEDLRNTQGNVEKLALLYANTPPGAKIHIDLYYRMSQKAWTAGTYAEIFGKGIRGKLGKRRALDYAPKVETTPVDVESYRRDLRLPNVIRDDKGKRLRATLEVIRKRGSGLSGDKMCWGEDYLTQQKDGAVIALASHSISGTWSTRWSSDHSLHSGWGFKVDAYTNETGSWKFLGWSWVQSNGRWQIDVPDSKNYEGNQLRVLYRSNNNYYRPQDQAGGTYTWGHDLTGIPTVYDVGHWYGDTDGGVYDGVGEMVDAAMTMWSRLHWDGGINPVMAAPIVLNYPNTWENCGGSSPWSCANWAGTNIWLIASHGKNATVVTHEMGHTLQGKYTNGIWPTGAGGSHSSNSCYPGKLGMALTEGFADFIPGWVGYPSRHVNTGGFSDPRWPTLALEARNSPPNCANGWENETWVARAFWDLHDTHTDGDDILWFIHRGAVIAIYLQESAAALSPPNLSTAMDMRDFREIYKSYATSGHEGFIDDIFDQNRM